MACSRVNVNFCMRKLHHVTCPWSNSMTPEAFKLADLDHCTLHQNFRHLNPEAYYKIEIYAKNRSNK